MTQTERECAEQEEVSFLPQSYRTRSPTFLVWWTGTLGQAEWLITHSPSLRGRSVARECPKSLTGIPPKMRPLVALEQPDLIITLPDGTGVMSIEITEQQEFGLNAQQRMARFWSAVACKVPSAYLLPLESYQIEEASSTLSLILDEPDSSRRETLLLGAVIPEVRGASLLREGVRSLEDLYSAVDSQSSAITSKARKRVADFLLKHVSRSGSVKHIPFVPPEEHLHLVDQSVYKVYLRPTGMPTSMLLEWMSLCSKRVPTYPFKMQSERRNMFRTSGVVHTIDDPENPHLSFRNLPPGPSTSETVNADLGKDEIQLFFDFVEAVLNNSAPTDLGREIFTAPNEFFNSEDRKKWRISNAKAAQILSETSADYQTSQSNLQELLDRLSSQSVTKWSLEVSHSVEALARSFDVFHVYKIKCSANRSLADPYSGALSVRDILFCRKEISGDLSKFQRDGGLVLLVDFTGDASMNHPFLYRSLDRLYQMRIKGGASDDPQQQLLELARLIRIERFPKDIRCHLIFSDLIIVRRRIGESVLVEAIVGIPGLIRIGALDHDAVAVRSLTR